MVVVCPPAVVVGGAVVEVCAAVVGVVAAVVVAVVACVCDVAGGAVVTAPAAGAVVVTAALATVAAVVAEPAGGAVVVAPLAAVVTAVVADPDPDDGAVVADASAAAVVVVSMVGESFVPTPFELDPHPATPAPMIATATTGAMRRRTLLPTIVPIPLTSLPFLVHPKSGRCTTGTKGGIPSGRKDPARGLGIPPERDTTTEWFGP